MDNWSKYKRQNYKTSREQHRKKSLYEVELGKEFSDMTPKARSTKWGGGGDKLDLCASKSHHLEN